VVHKRLLLLAGGAFCAKREKVRIKVNSVKMSFLIPVSYWLKIYRLVTVAFKDNSLIQFSNRIISRKK
jgi:hypothetical protein